MVFSSLKGLSPASDIGDIAANRARIDRRLIHNLNSFTNEYTPKKPTQESGT
jgi:hypothetical protein